METNALFSAESDAPEWSRCWPAPGLRLSRDRAGLVLDAVRAATAPGAGGLDVLFAAACLCDQLADYPDDTYDHASTS